MANISKENPNGTNTRLILTVQIVGLLFHFEWSYRDIRNLEIMSYKDRDFWKAVTKETTLSSFKHNNKNP